MSSLQLLLILLFSAGDGSGESHCNFASFFRAFHPYHYHDGHMWNSAECFRLRMSCTSTSFLKKSELVDNTINNYYCRDFVTWLNTIAALTWVLLLDHITSLQISIHFNYG